MPFALPWIDNYIRRREGCIDTRHASPENHGNTTEHTTSMPNVLILGGSGYLGTAIAQALLRSGSYAVWETARSAAKAAQLRAIEVTPAETINLADAQALIQAIDAHHFDAVIDASSFARASVRAFAAEMTAARTPATFS